MDLFECWKEAIEHPGRKTVDDLDAAVITMARLLGTSAGGQ